MAKKPNRTRAAEPDANEIAHGLMQSVIDRSEGRPVPKNPAAVELGRLGGLKGGPARKKALSAAERSRIAKKAAKARWGPAKTR